MCYVTTLHEYEEDIVTLQGTIKKNKLSKVMKCKVRGAIFQRKNISTVSTCKNFEEDFNFPLDTVEKLDSIIESRKKEIMYRI